MNLRGTSTTLVFALTVFACTHASSTQPERTGTESDGASGALDAPAGGECPFPAARDTAWPFPHGSGGESPSAYCPARCAPVEAAQLDAARGCRKWVLLGCMPCANGCGGAPEGPSCTKYASDGRLISVAPGYAFTNRTGWVACDAAEESASAAAPFCAD